MDERSDLEPHIAASRVWLVGICRGLTHDPDAAEDLAQETLIEAWRHAERLHAPESWRPWLAGIARNVHRRWVRAEARRARALVPVETIDEFQAPPGWEPERQIIDRELLGLVATGLATVPEASREALVKHCLDARSQAEIARQLGIGENAVAARVHRGKRSLRAAFEAPELRAALAAYGIEPVSDEADAWRDTRIICPLCGQHALRFRIDTELNQLSVRCSGLCLPRHDGNIIGAMRLLPTAQRLSSPKAILTQHLLGAHAEYQIMLENQGRVCHLCGGFMPVQLGAPESAYAAGVYYRCAVCDFVDDTSLWHLALDHPATQQFWRRYPRMRALPFVAIEHEGAPAILTGFESRDAASRIEMLYSSTRYDLLRIETAVA